MKTEQLKEIKKRLEEFIKNSGERHIETKTRIMYHNIVMYLENQKDYRRLVEMEDYMKKNSHIIDILQP